MTTDASIALYPGSFDPFTNGHLDIVTRAARLFDRVIVTILGNSAKQPLLPIAERVALARTVCAPLGNVEVEAFEGLLVEYGRRRAAVAVIRGVRGTVDFDYEWQMAMMNRQMRADLETVLLLPRPDVSFISSRLVKDILGAGGSVDAFVPTVVAEHLRLKLARS